MSHPLSGSTRVAAVIGHPVAHSLSPTIHNAGFVAAGIDWAYLAFDVDPGADGDAGAAAVAAMRTLQLAGLSVTMPLKASVAAAVDRLTPDARALGAVNCVAWDGSELVGHNTDGDGLVDALEVELDGGVAGRRVLVLGAGGAARSVVAALARRGAGSVGVGNRTRSRAEAAAALGGDVGAVASPNDAGDYEIIVNATSVGMAQTAAAGETPVDASLLHTGQVVVDLVYHPVQTRLLADAARAGAVAIDGIGMLVHQAARQFSLWTGGPAPLQAMDRAARAAVAASG